MANKLVHEQSPYLLQHAHNPVDWYPWSDEAFARAAAENKPVIVSIGYAACHWCHVMERESFEDPAVAAFMNAHFINIKVDREEHPAVDQLYMDAVQAITGSGGWPLNAFVTPDRVPFYGGTYFPPQPAYGRPSWQQLLERMHEVWTTNPEDVAAQTTQMQQYLRQTGTAPGAGGEKEVTADDCRAMVAALLKSADREWGGFGAAPKFPGTMAISFLLEQDLFAGNEAARVHALRSLDAMMAGGIYDQLGGGFARYSTDREWLAPHFEKMLYDNALLVLSLCDGWQATGDIRYRHCIEETIAFCNRELRHPSGGYFSALDADSEGVEGKFYTWTAAEWEAAMQGDEYEELAALHFGVREEGNWEETNILHIAVPLDLVAKEFSLPEREAQQKMARVKEKLFRLRAQRIRPHTDDKCLLSWNALMNTALSRAGRSLQQPEYIRMAEEHATWMLETYTAGESLLHTWKEGRARIDAHLDDHAYLIQALLQLSTAANDDKWLTQALGRIPAVLAGFGDEDDCFFYFSHAGATDIPVRKIDLYDGVTPSANAVMAHNLILAGLAAEQPAWTERGRSMLRRAAGSALRYPQSFGYWAQLLQRTVRGWHTVHSSGEDAEKHQATLAGRWWPHVFVLPADKTVTGIAKTPADNAKPPLLVCNEWACLPPLHETEAVAKLLSPLLTDV